MRSTSRRSSIGLGLALALALAATGSLGGCALFAAPDPPPAVTTAVDEALTELRATHGVAEASGDASPTDSMWGGRILDDPQSWIARFTITAEPRVTDLAALATDIDETLTAARRTVSSAAYLDLESTGAAASAHLNFSTEPTIAVDEMVVAATALREVDGATEVWVSTYPSPARVHLEGPEQWTDAAATIRAMPGFGGELPAVTLSSPLTDDPGTDGHVTLDAVSPTPSLIAAFAGMSGTDGVRTAALDAVRPVGLVDEIGAWRPMISLTVDADETAVELAAQLVALPDAVSAVTGVPRATFSVRHISTNVEVAGFVGLPLGAQPPADGVPLPAATSAPPPVDPRVAAARLEEGRGIVASLLDEAGDLAGIRGTPALDTIPCAEDRGAQVRGSVVVPVFEITDRADDAFARITQAWTDRGYEYTDRGMGTDIYAAPGLESLTIRGTAEGIRIIATASCSAPG
jgi:hypothetical protein